MKVHLLALATALPLLAQEENLSQGRNLYIETVRTPAEIIVVVNNQSRESVHARVVEIQRENAEQRAAIRQCIAEKFGADREVKAASSRNDMNDKKKGEKSFHALVLADTPEEARARLAELRRKHDEENAANQKAYQDDLTKQSNAKKDAAPADSPTE